MGTNDFKYSNRALAFLDILGFENIVKESINKPELIQKIASILELSKQIALSFYKSKFTILKVDPNQYSHRMFSDTIVISGPYLSHDDFILLSWWTMFHQYFLWKREKTFIRGGIAYGGMYEDEDIIFGPALIDAYHLESDKGKSAWPRVLIDKSLLNEMTSEERKRDSLEFIRQDTDNLVHLDYLKELFHLFVIAENQRVTGGRMDDFGIPTNPINLFDEHKEAILAQVTYAKKLEDEEILSKYVELSKYHNSTIERLRQIIREVKNNNSLISDFFDDQIKSINARKLGKQYVAKYSAEEHPEQSDMLNILGTVINKTIENPPPDILKAHGIVIIGQTDDMELGKAIRAFSQQAPVGLSILDETLEKAIIDI